MTKSKEKTSAKQLRSLGLSIREIATQVKVSSSSVFGWVKDIPLTEDQKHTLLSRPQRGPDLALYNKARGQKYETIRNNWYEEGLQCADEVLSDRLTRDAVA